MLPAAILQLGVVVLYAKPEGGDLQDRPEFRGFLRFCYDAGRSTSSSFFFLPEQWGIR
jgi:hypothetical protein